MSEVIEESGMKFGPYPEGHCFYIEKSGLYQQMQQNVKIAEFLLLRLNRDRPPCVLVVEAKSSSPQASTQPRFDEYIDEIKEKLVNAFSLGLAACLRRHAEAEQILSKQFKNLDLGIASFRFILVIKGHKAEWLPPLNDALKNVLHSTLQTWSLKPASVAVMNEEMARTHHLIL